MRVRGTRARNIERQPKVSTSTPPPRVAAIMPNVDMAAINPNALPRSSDGNMLVISAGADAAISPLPIACITRSPSTNGRVGARPIREHRQRISRQSDDVETTQAIDVGSAAQSEVEACAAADIQHDYPLNGAEVRAQVGCDVWQGDIDRKVEGAEEHAECCRDQPEPLVRCLD